MEGTRPEEEEFEMLLGEISRALPSQQILSDNQQRLTNGIANLSLKEDGHNPSCLSNVPVPSDVMGKYTSEQFNGGCSLNSVTSSATSSSSDFRSLSGGLQPALDNAVSYHGEGTIQSTYRILKRNRPNPQANNWTLPSPDFTAHPHQIVPMYSTAAPPAYVSGLQQQCCLRSQTVNPLQQEIDMMRLNCQVLEKEMVTGMQQQSMLLQEARAQYQALAVGLPNDVSLDYIPGYLYSMDARQKGLYPSMNTCLQQAAYKRLIHEGSAITEENRRTRLGPGMTEGNRSARLISSTNEGSSSAQGLPMASGNAWGYYAQGYCGRREGSCPFPLCQMPIVSGRRISQRGLESSNDAWIAPKFNPKAIPALPENVLTRSSSQGLNSVMTMNPGPSIGLNKFSPSNGRTFPNGHHLPAGSFQLDIQGHYRGASSESTESELPPRSLTGSHQQQSKYTCLEEIEGRIYSIAKDQHGCRFLQRKFDDRNPEDVQKIFVEIIDHIVELMTDPFGNYLVQKLLDVCNEKQRMEILHAVTGKEGELVNISLNMHGTRAVQKLIETLKTPQEISMVISSLKPGAVTLIKDLNGNHVVQRCLQRLSNEESEFLFDAAAAYCVEIATHRHGCCVLQRCIDYSTGTHRQCLLAEIASNALVLSQDPFGNYVVQYVLDLGIPWATVNIMVHLEGNYVHLSMQKFSSNVVEKCLKLSDEENHGRIIWELINSSQLAQLLQDPYANYVVQSALAVSKGVLHAAFVEAIRPHLPALRSSPFGKRILSCTSLKK